MIAGRHSMMGGKALPFDAEVEWLSSDTTVSVNTGYYPCDSTEITCDMSSSSNGLVAILCNYVSEQDAFRLDASDTSGLFLDYGKGAGIWRIAITTGGNTWWKNQNIRLVAGNCFVRDEVTGYASSRSTVTFNRKDRQLIVRLKNAGAKIRSATISESGVLVRDFIPVRCGSGASAVGCLYDKRGVGGMNADGSARNDGLYFNSGTSTFVVGPDTSYQQGGGKWLGAFSSFWRSSRCTRTAWKEAA